MLKILVADDHAIVRRGIRQILEAMPEVGQVAEASSGDEALASLQAEAWDIVLLDLSMPGRGGLEILSEARALRPTTRVLVLSMHPEDQFALRVLRQGAAGYLNKDAAVHELQAAVHQIMRGGKYLSPATTERLPYELENPTDMPRHALLSPREFQVLCLLASGQRTKEIAQRLGLSVKTVSTFRARLLTKLRLNSNAELIHYAYAHHLLGEAVDQPRTGVALPAV